MEELTKNLIVQVVMSLFYLLLFIVGVCGNILVFYKIIQNPNMHKSVTNIFIANLTVCNALMSVLSPITPLFYMFMENWIFGRFACKIIHYLIPVSKVVNSWTLATIAFYRYRLVTYPFEQKMKTSMCLFITSSIWALSMLMSLPFYLYTELYVYSFPVYPSSSFCFAMFPWERNITSTTIFNILYTVFIFIIPLVIITFCYTQVTKKLLERSRTATKLFREVDRYKQKTKKTIKLLVIMMATFFALWLPVRVFILINEFHPLSNQNPYHGLVFLITHWIAMSSTCINPYIYAYHNEDFKENISYVSKKQFTPRLTIG